MSEKSLLDRLAAGEVLVSDGATGTNLQQKGLPVGAAAEEWVLGNPEAIKALNRSFIEAGSDILLTCTFGGTRLRLAASNLAEKFETINRKAVEITREAAQGHDVLVAGSIGPTGHMLAPLGTVSVDEAEENFREQARLLLDSRVDLIVIETQFDISEALAAVRGVRSVDAEIPLVCSFSYDRGTRTMMGVRPDDMASEIGARDVDVIGVNCGRSLNENLEVLTRLHEVSDKPIWFKPNAGMPDTDEEGKPTYSVSPQEMASLVPAWMKTGAQIIGGCCGTSPAHLSAIARVVKR
ncbi:MAG: homocysteine S-methyltransferase family protein [Brevefilum sp.]